MTQCRICAQVLIGTPDFDALWFVAYKTEYNRGTLMQDRRADDGVDVHANFCGILAPIVDACVEINQCVGCTRQFFTKSLLGDEAVRNRHRHAIERASRRGRGQRTRREFDLHTGLRVL